LKQTDRQTTVKTEPQPTDEEAKTSKANSTITAGQILYSMVTTCTNKSSPKSFLEERVATLTVENGIALFMCY